MPEKLSKSQRNWRDIAEEAAREKDPARLAALIQALCRAFDEDLQPREKSSQGK